MRVGLLVFKRSEFECRGQVSRPWRSRRDAWEPGDPIDTPESESLQRQGAKAFSADWAALVEAIGAKVAGM